MVLVSESPDTAAADELRPAGAPLARIRKRRDFLAANAGARVVTPAFILLVHPNDAGETRVGFTASRKVGNAVARNRARRRLREVARALLPTEGVAAADHIFIARTQPAERPYAALMADAQQAIGKARRKLAGRKDGQKDGQKDRRKGR